ncbi:uncharacterized protein KY384_000799 [Bacidia gigantensis]|uniref:uncharacterized protein n=1 Tax=Bacidia gigantensis TaxID=2732470 RepID=UPI001D040491|nr:uncharacterized protein KY384_000799 [Bacidia gigantensis]KAG8526037.1 hypothetical protein KY384_000799 [Bacidia gigantensis]
MDHISMDSQLATELENKYFKVYANLQKARRHGAAERIAQDIIDQMKKIYEQMVTEKDTIGMDHIQQQYKRQISTLKRDSKNAIHHFAKAADYGTKARKEKWGAEVQETLLLILLDARRDVILKCHLRRDEEDLQSFRTKARHGNSGWKRFWLWVRRGRLKRKEGRVDSLRNDLVR